MPKRKPDQVIVHRLELQDKEREALELFVASTSVKNVGIGVGAVALPLGIAVTAFGAVIAAWVAKEGIEELLTKWEGFQKEAQSRFDTQKKQAYIDSGSDQTYEEWSATGAPARATWWRRQFYKISFGVIGDPE